MSLVYKIIFVVLFMCALVHASHHHHGTSLRSKKAQAEIQSFIKKRSDSSRTFGRLIASRSLYDNCHKILANLTKVASDVESNAFNCEKNGATDKNEQINQLKSNVTALKEQVNKITTSLNTCVSFTSDLNLLKCLNKDAQYDLQMLASVMSTAQSLQELLNGAFQNVAIVEEQCIRNATIAAKQAANGAYNAYEKCLIENIQIGDTNSQLTTPTPTPSETSIAATTSISNVTSTETTSAAPPVLSTETTSAAPPVLSTETTTIAYPITESTSPAPRTTSHNSGEINGGTSDEDSTIIE